MQYLFVASGTLTLFIMALILGRKEKSLPNIVLVAWLVLFVINLISLFILYEVKEPFSIPQQLILEFSEVSIFAHGPLLWLYTKSLTEIGFQLKWKHLLHFMPFVIAYLYFLIQIFRGPAILPLVRNAITILKMGSLLAYLVFVLVKLRRHQVQVEHIFSNTEEKNLVWISFLSWGILIIWGIATGSLLLDRFTDVHIPHYGGVIAHVAICIFIFFMGYFGLNQPSVFSQHRNYGFEPNTTENPKSQIQKGGSTKYRNSGLDTMGSRQIQSHLLELMKTAKPFLEKELTLYGLAEKLQVQPNHLSQVINSLEGKNFFDFVNMYRVEEAKERIIQGNRQNLTLLGIAFESGFNSKASFNRAFKKITGQTPSEFSRMSATT